MKLAALPDKYKRAHFDRVELYENDVLMLMRSFHPNLSTLFDVLSIYMLESDVAEVRKIVADIEDRITRQSQRFRNDHS